MLTDECLHRAVISLDNVSGKKNTVIKVANNAIMALTKKLIPKEEIPKKVGSC